MTRRAWFVSLILGLPAALFAPSSLLAADVPSEESQATANKIVAEWYDAAIAGRNLAVEIETKVVMTKDGVAKNDEAAYRLTIEQPNRLALRTVKGPKLTVVADGKQVFEHVDALKRFQLSGSAPQTVVELAATKSLQLANLRLGLGIVGDALKAKSFDAFWKTYTSPEYVGLAEKNGKKARHVRLTRDAMPFDFWFAADAPQLLAAEPDLKVGLAGSAQSLPPGVTYAIATNYKYVDVAPAETFAIETPHNAEQVNDLFNPAPHKLVGQPAPAFSTTDLAGVAVKLADLHGKVVLLDFWATWCGPCIRALPRVNATATKFQERGVVFYAVNQEEEAPMIQAFLDSRELKVPVALDLDGAINRAYGVEGIPQLVIIDRQGKVQVVHVGAGPNVDEELANDLEAVLAGKDLAAEKLRNAAAK